MATAGLSGKQHLARSGPHTFSSSDDNVMMKQIQATHAPDDREIVVRPILHIVEEILCRATLAAPTILPAGQAQIETLDEKVPHSDFDEHYELLSLTLNKISCEMNCKWTGGADAHATTIAVLNLLSTYSWDAKVVLALAAFAVGYGEFWLVAQLYTTNPLAKGVAILKQLPEVLKQANSLRPKFESLTNLINAMLNVTKCTVEFKELPSQYISPDEPEFVAATAHIPTAVYWIIRSIVACAAQIMGLVSMGHEYIASTTEAWELSSLAHKLSSIRSHLLEQLRLCQQHIDEKKNIEAYETLKHIMETPYLDNVRILKALIYAKDDQLPLLDGTGKSRVSLDVLRRKNVLLLISDLDLLHEELSILEQMYQEAKQHPTRPESQYEVVWIPVVDRSNPWDAMKQQQFETLKSMMPWHSVHHPSMIEPAVLRFIKEEWRFHKKPLLVVLDPQGRVVNPNAIHMMWIWGSLAFPFTSIREEILWKGETWRIELLADSIEPAIFNWIAEGKYICLYGGEDMDWIRKFTTAARAIATAAGIQLEMLYVGKSNPKEKVRRNSATIQAEKRSHVLADLTIVWFFWVRLESMWHSKVAHDKTVEDDPIMQEIVTMLSFDASEQGWAVISRGSAEMAKAKGETMLKSFNQYDEWKGLAESEGFIPALNKNLHDIHPAHHCNRLILPGTAGNIPERVVCAECGKVMEKFYMYRCCTD